MCLCHWILRIGSFAFQPIVAAYYKFISDIIFPGDQNEILFPFTQWNHTEKHQLSLCKTKTNRLYGKPQHFPISQFIHKVYIVLIWSCEESFRIMHGYKFEKKRIAMFGKLIVCRMKAEILDDIGQTPCFVQILFITMLLEEKFKINQSSSFRRRIMNLVYMSGFVFPFFAGWQLINL